jgi:ferrous iron transport protein A
MKQDAAPITLDKLPLKSGGAIVRIDWTSLEERDARRLRELGVDEGV